MNEKKAKFLPFHAVNDFMRSDYRLEVVRSTLNASLSLPVELRTSIERLTKKYVQVPGFRNSAKAPINLRIKPTADAFEKNPHLVATILAAWAASRPELWMQVYALLEERNWQLLPPDTDRTQLPGFIITWPKGEEFSVLNAAFSVKYPELNLSSDDVSLMIVWISMRLPYQSNEEET